MPLRRILFGGILLVLVGCLSHPNDRNPLAIQEPGSGSSECGNNGHSAHSPSHSGQGHAVPLATWRSCMAMSNEASPSGAASLLIEGMSEESPPNAAMNLLMLYAIGENCIPALLQAGLDQRRVSFAFPYPSLLSGIPSDQEVHPTTGMVCLYLTQSIEKRRLFHSSIGTGGDAIQREILRQYTKWWEAHSGNQTLPCPEVGWDNLGDPMSELQTFLIMNEICRERPDVY